MVNPVAFLIVVLLAIVTRLLFILPTRRTKGISAFRKARDTCTVAVFLGSGGHTSEALALISALDWGRYTHRIYIINEGDGLSAQKARDLEQRCAKDSSQFSIITIPRARHVHQPLWSTVRSALHSLLVCVYYFTLQPLRHLQKQVFADILILNGPGTCFVLCIAIYVNKFLGLTAPVVIYVESFARVKSLSLSGKLIRPLADHFITQWPPKPRTDSLKSEYWLV